MSGPVDTVKSQQIQSLARAVNQLQDRVFCRKSWSQPLLGHLSEQNERTHEELNLPDTGCYPGLQRNKPSFEAIEPDVYVNRGNPKTQS